MAKALQLLSERIMKGASPYELIQNMMKPNEATEKLMEKNSLLSGELMASISELEPV